MLLRARSRLSYGPERVCAFFAFFGLNVGHMSSCVRLKRLSSTEAPEAKPPGGALHPEISFSFRSRTAKSFDQNFSSRKDLCI